MIWNGYEPEKDGLNEFLKRVQNGKDTRSDDINTPGLPETRCNILMTAVKSPKKEMQNIYYIVRLKERYRQELCLTTITRDFCGKIVNQTAENIYFELNGSDALVIIPHNWIKWLAPSEKLWNINKGK